MFEKHVYGGLELYSVGQADRRATMQKKLLLLDELQCELIQLQKLQELAKSKNSPMRCLDPLPYRPPPMDAMDTLPMEPVTPYDDCVSTTKA